MAWYNGYSSRERTAKGRVGKTGRADGSIPIYTGACMLCGDPEVPVEPHSEDYSRPYRWDPPAVYWLCGHCHKHKLHRRFWQHDLWEAFLAHVRRGGYARDLKDPAVRAEFREYRRARRLGEPGTLRTLRTSRTLAPREWWDELRMDEASLTDPAARPRPDEA